MGKFAEFMDKVKADEALQKEFAEIIGDSGEKLTKEQKEKIAELAGKLGIELNIEGELSDEALGSIAGGWVVERPVVDRPVQWVIPLPYEPTTMEWGSYTHTYRCKNCGKTKTVSLEEIRSLGLEYGCPAEFPGLHEYELIKSEYS